MGRLAPEVLQLWDAAGGLLDREVRRIAQVVAGDHVAERVFARVGGTRDPGGRIIFQPLVPQFAHGPPAPLVLGLAPRVEVVPLIVGQGPGMLVIDVVGAVPTIRGVGYPMDKMTSLVGDDGAPRSLHPLTALLGDLRAEVLGIVGEPRTMGELADHVHASPSRLSYHVKNLEAAGLVRRVRDGAFVTVQRTDLGDALMRLLS